MNSRRIARRQMALLLVFMTFTLGIARAQDSEEARKKAIQEYEETVRQADALVSAGNPFEAVRMYERAGRVAYNNKLTTDTAALNAKLAAARTARDLSNAAPTTATPPAANQTAPSPAPTSTTSSAGGTSSQDYADWVHYGDGLTEVGEHIDAVRAYERARRIAVNNRIPYDPAALEAKIAAATKARDTPRVKTELIPMPLPPVPDAPGAEPGIRWLPQQPGKLRPWSVSALYSKAEMHVTPSEFQAFEGNLRKVMEVVTKAPVLSPPTGFEFDVSASLDSFQDVKERERYLSSRLPLRGNIRFSGSPYVEMQLRSKSTGASSTGIGLAEEAACRYEITVNVPPPFDSHLSDRFDDGEDTLYVEPKKNGELGGLPVYNDTLVIARPGTALWTPVSMEMALNALMPSYKSAAEMASSAIAGRGKAYAEFMTPEAQQKRRLEVDGLRNAGGSSAADNARRLEVKQRRWEDDARKEAETAENDPKFRGPIDAYHNAQAMLASPDAAGRAAQACVVTGVGRSPVSDWRIVPMGTPGCGPLVHSNPGLLNGRLPRSNLQVMYVKDLTVVNRWLEEKKFLRNQPGDCVAMAKILRQVEWQQLVGLLAK